MKKYLALGDSYTIGEQVKPAENFPHQLQAMLNQDQAIYAAPHIIAVTGWTTDELSAAIAAEKPGFDHDLVTLLVGVNNQYRGRSTEEYYWQFYSLVCQAILYAKSIPERVVVLSIPDWGLTPFNKDRDRSATSAAIDDFNKINLDIARRFGCRYVDITPSTRAHANDLTYLAEDRLHYSGKEYNLWAARVRDCLR
jgi:lysophospholipase L1-like esterase